MSDIDKVSIVKGRKLTRNFSFEYGLLLWLIPKTVFWEFQQ